MKIVSKFSDYYDGLANLGHDDSLIYLRKTVEYDYKQENLPEVIKTLTKIPLHPNNHSYGYYEKLTYRWKGPTSITVADKSMWKIDTHLEIIFCGKVYLPLKFSQYQKDSLVPSREEYVYDEESAIAFCKKVGIDVNLTERYSKTTILNSIKTHFIVSPIDKDWMIENKVICIARTIQLYKHPRFSYLQNQNFIVVNPCLKELQFAKAVDPYQAWQELEMWIGGTLAWPQNAMVEISDISKVKKHGFDSKYSFRTRPK